MSTGTAGRRRGRVRRGPFAVIPIFVVLALALGACTSSDDDDDNASGDDTTTTASGSNSNLPLTYAAAKADGKEGDIEWGDQCDTEIGRLKVPVVNAPPCVEPYTGTDNGGATAQGVTADEILVAVYKGQPDPLQQAIIEGAGADTDPNTINQTTIDYLKMFEDIVETYGRTLKIETIEATGGPADSTAALADAQKAIALKPFAVVGGPAQTPAWWQEITNAKIVCVGGCSLAQTQDIVDKAAPYLWPTGPAPEQADAHLEELVGKQLAGKPVEYATDALNGKDRVYGWIQAETQTGQYQQRIEAAEKNLKDDYDVDISADYTYLYDPANAQQISTTAVARMKDAGVTTVILSVDPLIPADITKEATKQNYFPEWVLGPNVLMDTTIFGRRTDQDQWSHMIGISLPTARGQREQSDSYLSYQWYYGKEVPVNSQAVLYPAPWQLLVGISLAGPNLTPETYRDGLFNYPSQEGLITSTYVSWGNDLWPTTDYNSSDDSTAIFWDRAATGKDEAGNEGTGMVAYVDGGKRYLPGQWPTEKIPFYDDPDAVTIYDQRPDAA
ncbi:MAG TPA: hypothetical protein VFX21_15445, partial [Acidimicrobiia bacterium]|nr:hypothetical protein [Acidimicrobiia bacterium]